MSEKPQGATSTAEIQGLKIVTTFNEIKDRISKNLSVYIRLTNGKVVQVLHLNEKNGTLNVKNEEEVKVLEIDSDLLQKDLKESFSSIDEVFDIINTISEKLS